MRKTFFSIVAGASLLVPFQSMSLADSPKAEDVHESVLAASNEDAGDELADEDLEDADLEDADLEDEYEATVMLRFAEAPDYILFKKPSEPNWQIGRAHV